MKSPVNCKKRIEATVINPDGCNIEMMWTNNAIVANLRVLVRMENIFSHHSFVLGAFIQLDQVWNAQDQKPKDWRKKVLQSMVIEQLSSFIIIL